MILEFVHRTGSMNGILLLRKIYVRRKPFVFERNFYGTYLLWSLCGSCSALILKRIDLVLMNLQSVKSNVFGTLHAAETWPKFKQLSEKQAPLFIRCIICCFTLRQVTQARSVNKCDFYKHLKLGFVVPSFNRKLWVIAVPLCTFV